MYKVLTLWQPWATLFAHGIKKIETRPKPTSYEGTYLIHAAKQFNKYQKDICKKEYFAEALESLGIKNDNDLVRGAVVGAYDHIQCVELITDEKFRRFLDYPERAFGDYTPGRYAWIGENHRVLQEPIPYKNGQGYYLNFKGDESKLIFK